MKNYLGVDVGGTFVKLAVVDESGTIGQQWKIPTDLAGNGAGIPASIVASVRENLGECELSGVGVGVPGSVSVDGMLVERAVNLGWENMPLKKELEEALDVPVALVNDANAAALGELWQGSTSGCKNLLFVTLGTGVGGGIVLDGKLLVGSHSAGGEIGHIPVRSAERRICGCGNVNCLESFASANGFVATMHRILDEAGQDRGDFTTVDIMNWVAEGDELAQRALDELVDVLGGCLAGLLNSLDVEEIVVGGGLSAAGEALLAPLRKVVDEEAFPQIRGRYVLRQAKLGNDAGVLGAVYAVMTA